MQDEKYADEATGRVILHLRQGMTATIEVTNKITDYNRDSLYQLIWAGDIAMYTQTLYVSRIFWLYKPEDGPLSILPSLGTRSAYSTYSGSQKSFQFVRENLESCLTSHTNCRRSRSATLPRRVLHVGHQGDRLVTLVEDCMERAAYITLSYCWGTALQPLLLKKVNQRRLERGIPLQEFPVLFRDTIDVCRQLSVAYLWIDALCIVQDSSKDWEIESAKMCQYYGNSILTISASSSPSSDVPIFTERDRRWWSRCFDLDLGDGVKVGLLAREHLQSTVEHCADGGGRLTTRGWVWQENVLASRVIRFGRSGLIWDCRSTESVVLEDGEIPWPLCKGRRETSLETAVQKTPFRTWRNMVASYTQRELTYRTDTLPAISGAAFLVHQHTRCAYFAGLWQDNLITDLCWITRQTRRKPLYQDKTYIAPSWAWPSTGQHTGYLVQDHNFVQFAKVQAISTSTKSPNAFGQVTDGSLVICGKLGCVRVVCKDPRDFMTYRVPATHPKDPRQYVSPDCALSTQNNMLKRADEGDELNPIDANVPCILLLKGSLDRGLKDKYAALLLESLPVTTDLDGGDSMRASNNGLDLPRPDRMPRYRRIGLVVLNGEEAFSQFETTITII